MCNLRSSFYVHSRCVFYKEKRRVQGVANRIPSTQRNNLAPPLCFLCRKALLVNEYPILRSPKLPSGFNPTCPRLPPGRHLHARYTVQRTQSPAGATANNRAFNTSYAHPFSDAPSSQPQACTNRSSAVGRSLGARSLLSYLSIFGAVHGLVTSPSILHPFIAPFQVHFFVSFDMGDQSESSRFQELFESALQDYQHQTGISLPEHPLAQQLQNCNSVESIITILQQQANAFSEFRGRDGILKSLKNITSVLCKLSATAGLDDAVGLVCWEVLMPYLRIF